MSTDGTAGRTLRAWLPVLAYIALIFVLSAQPNLASPFHFQNGDKFAHTLEYGGLGVLLVNALRGGGGLDRPLAAGLLALLIGLTIAGCDEWFQSTSGGGRIRPGCRG